MMYNTLYLVKILCKISGVLCTEGGALGAKRVVEMYWHVWWWVLSIDSS